MSDNLKSTIASMLCTFWLAVFIGIAGVFWYQWQYWAIMVPCEAFKQMAISFAARKQQASAMGREEG